MHLGAGEYDDAGLGQRVGRVTPALQHAQRPGLHRAVNPALRPLGGDPMTLGRRRQRAAAAVVLLAVFWGCVYCMKMGMDDPFLYFRF